MPASPASVKMRKRLVRGFDVTSLRLNLGSSGFVPLALRKCLVVENCATRCCRRPSIAAVFRIVGVVMELSMTTVGFKRTCGNVGLTDRRMTNARLGKNRQEARLLNWSSA